MTPGTAGSDGPRSFARRFAVSRETLVLLEVYVELLIKWQRTINLVAPSTLADVWGRHFGDSAQLLALAPAASLKWLDLGSGAGFPGLVLGIMLRERPGARVTLVESDQRKAAFLGAVARATGAPVDILCTRIENVSTQARIGAVDVITARALAPLPRLLGYSAPFFGPGTVALLLKGREVDAELAAAGKDWSFACELVVSMSDDEARIAVVRDVRSKPRG